MKKISLLFVIVLFGTLSTAFAQSISVSGQFGWAIPQGDAFKPEGGEPSAKGGLAYDLDALYFLPNFDNKLGVGVNYKGDLLFGLGEVSGLYSLQLYAAKGYYKFFTSKVTPYAALSLGLSQFGTPDYTYSVGGDEPILVKGVRKSSFGIAPEIGVQFGSFFIAANYLVPMKYKFEGVSTSAGALAISIGYRYNLDI